MSESNVIQNQIRLVAFKATKVEFWCNQNPQAIDLKPKFEIKLSDLLVRDKPTWFSKVFTISLTAPTGPIPETVNFNIEYHTFFECTSPIDSVFLGSEFAKISAPAIGFPYVRAFISTISVQAGLPPIIIPSINFVQFNKEEEAKLAGQVDINFSQK